MTLTTGEASGAEAELEDSLEGTAVVAAAIMAWRPPIHHSRLAIPDTKHFIEGSTARVHKLISAREAAAAEGAVM
jgi:hypothetical protein